MFKVENFSCYCSCKGYQVKEYGAVCNDFSYCFTPNIYILKGDIDFGALAFVCSISNKSRNTYIYPPTSFELDGKEIPLSKAHMIACPIEIYKGYHFYEKNITFYKAIERKIKKYHFAVSADELFEQFGVDDQRIHREIYGLGNLYWPVYRAMSGLIEGKKVFTTMWQGRYGFCKHYLEKIGRVLVQYGCTLIIPSSAKNEFSEDCVSLEMTSLFDNPDLREFYSNN